MATETVNQVMDPKGLLKGKGAGLAQWDREARDRLAAVRADMAQLAEATRTIEGRRFGLLVNKLRDAQQLRWRFTSVVDAGASRHTTWQRVEALLPTLSPVLAQWYREVNELALILNHKEQVARYEVKTTARLLEGLPRTERLNFTATVGRGFGGGRPRQI